MIEPPTERFRWAAPLLVEAADDTFAFATFPNKNWRELRSNNPQERLNKEIRPRTHVVDVPHP